jgi:hypothetical protein
MHKVSTKVSYADVKLGTHGACEVRTSKVIDEPRGCAYSYVAYER